MRRTRWSTSPLLAAAACVLAMSACGDDGGKGTPAASKTAGSKEAGDGYPVTIENCGRKLTFDGPPSRVLTSYQPTLETLMGLGVGDKVIGRTKWTGAERSPPLEGGLTDKLEAIPTVSPGTNNWLPSKEEVIALSPDFVLSGGFYEFDAKQGFATREELEDAGAQSYLSQCSSEDGATITVEDTYRVILDLGKIFGVSDRAQQRVAQMKKRIAAVRQKVAGRRPVKTLIVYLAGKSLTVQGASIEGEVVELAGGENVLADERQFFEANDEAISAEPVEAFLVLKDVPGEPADAAELFERFPDLPASRDRRAVETTYLRTGGGVAGAWRQADAVEHLAKQLHPEAFAP
jgi:iron complex transport system substrate-binding protein